ncbi:ATP-binding protein [Salipiger sp. H15]|uniref:ATP-binding protein n=1 Tax=Alloyangia sp. H15 TaxID=3029062 RepID=A0AAU8AMF6_9RHOB
MTAGGTPTPDMTLALLREGLDRAIAASRARLEAAGRGAVPPDFELPGPSALPVLAARFNLLPEEVELVTLAAGVERDPEAGALDVATAAALWGPVTWDMLCPEAPLRRWRLVELTGTGPLHRRGLRLDERVLHFLLGTSYLDARLEGMVVRALPVPPEGARAGAFVEAIRAAWTGTPALPVLLLGGPDAAAKRGLAAAALDGLGVPLLRMAAGDIPEDWAQRAALAVFLDRELALSGSAVLIEAEDGQGASAARFADGLTGPTLLSATEPPVPERAPRRRLELAPPEAAERAALWQAALARDGSALPEEACQRLATQFALDPGGIGAAVARAGSAAPGELWHAARLEARSALDGLADRIDSSAGWDDLILPPEQTEMLRDLAEHLHNAWRVNGDWGWAARGARGLGVAALFAGPSGTGKTLAAEVIAGALGLDLYRIDLSQVVSKYIGETEKNLARIFGAAERSGAILLFDEADALFGKRSEVKDSHDRYANVEVSYLLQRMEAYRGLAVLTTNQRAALDRAFLRRLRYVLSFPFPDAAARAAIWARIFPAETPLDGLDPQALARLPVAGGAIRSIALNASYLAARGPGPVTMAHVERAARREYAKMEKPFTGAEQGVFR